MIVFCHYLHSIEPSVLTSPPLPDISFIDGLPIVGTLVVTIIMRYTFTDRSFLISQKHHMTSSTLFLFQHLKAPLYNKSVINENTYLYVYDYNYLINMYE